MDKEEGEVLERRSAAVETAAKALLSGQQTQQHAAAAALTGVKGSSFAPLVPARVSGQRKPATRK